jgi:sulfur carrier protein ThiS
MKIHLTKFDDRSPIELEVDDKSTAYDVLKKLELTPDTMIVLRDDQPIPIDEELNENDKIKIIQVISGG